MNRIERLTAILIHLQSKRLVKGEELSDRFGISLRTVYRDVRALMEAGVPIGSEAGKGYFIVDGYSLPPVMLTREEAGAMLMAAKLVEKMTDKSIRDAYESVLTKIKCVLRDEEKDNLDYLQQHVVVHRSTNALSFPDQHLGEIQKATVDKEVISITYFSSYNESNTEREVEPIGLFYYGEAWHLIAWCRLRNGYRDFRADRIQQLKRTGKSCNERNLISLQDYLENVARCHSELHKVQVLFDRETARFIANSKHAYGFVSEEHTSEGLQVTFLHGSIIHLCKWLLMHGTSARIISPEKARDTMRSLISELNGHYMDIPEESYTR